MNTWTDADKARWAFRALGLGLGAVVWFGARKSIRNQWGRGALSVLAAGGTIAYGERKAEMLEIATPTAGETVSNLTDFEKLGVYTAWGKV